MSAVILSNGTSCTGSVSAMNFIQGQPLKSVGSPDGSMSKNDAREKTFHVRYLDAGVTLEDVYELLNMNMDLGGITLRNNPESGENFAEVCITGSGESIANLAGSEFRGKELVIEEGERAAETQQPQQQAPLLTLAEVAAVSAKSTMANPTSRPADFVEYVIIDTTKCNNPYHVPSHAEVVHAIRCQYPNILDEQRKVLRLWGRQEGLWKIEAANLDRYRNHNSLVYEGRTLGTVEIKRDAIQSDEDGKVSIQPVNTRRQQHEEDDLLITLKGAHTERFSSITDEMILEKIVQLNVGRVKKAPQPQRWSRESDELNGNKFVVLSGVPKEESKKIPTHFEFFDKRFGLQRMVLTHKHQQRYCFYCGKHHDASCPLKEAEKRFVKERDEVKREVKIYGSSELRYCQQGCLATDIDAMSGGTTGNILNAIEVDESNTEIPNLVLVTGKNDLQARVSPEEFALSLKVKQRRLTALAKEKTVAILQPPSRRHMDPIDEAKEVIFHAHLKEVAEVAPNVKIWPNPITQYEEDGGSHPSPEQTVELLHYIDQMTKKDMGVTIFLPSGPNEYMTSQKKYSGVKSLYKYGCAACSDKNQNKWWGLCTNCTEQALLPEKHDLAYAVQVFNETVRSVHDRENPPLQNSPAYGEHSGSSSIRDRSPLKDSTPDVSTGSGNAVKKIKFFNDSEN